MENLSIKTNTRFPRDLLRRFTIGSSDAGPPRRSDPEEDLGSGSGDEVELNLGLSLGGRFGVDKSKLVRSSSIAAILPVTRDDDVLASGQGNTGPGRSFSALIRTSSLPVETEEEWRKRKELQSLRRLAAKRRRSEKQRNLTKGERDEYVAAMGRVGSSPGPPFRLDKWSSGGAIDVTSGGGTTAAGDTTGGAAGGGLSSQASQESQGSISEYQSTHRQGSSGSGGETSSLQERNNNQDAIGSSCSNPPERENIPARNPGKEIGSSAMEEMPCVFTQGDGPNGRVIEGILYKYGRGEQVKILCACHGSFLSPAEFVQHAGGTDVLHPLRHIVVKPSSSFS